MTAPPLPSAPGTQGGGCSSSVTSGWSSRVIVCTIFSCFATIFLVFFWREWSFFAAFFPPLLLMFQLKLQSFSHLM